ncbi:Nuclear transcription factor Y subunit B-6 [Ananas comosus]|uniref:Nuclear transcription factor Y subunit B-6 n=1 Tax=Ananas comosus TaxID=4615 RepID=A0A199UMK9_ANACO|nr:Nuclear transcription factor Y subunit B-6 [Ananas comosus]
MEGVGGGSRSFQGLQGDNLGFPVLAAEADPVQQAVQHEPAAAVGGGGGHQAPQQHVREQDRLMPIANVIRIMRRVLPTHAKIADDAKETMQECVSEYISFITSEANERCQREQRKTITADDILWAMSRLGFQDYVEPLSVFLHRYRQAEGDHRGSLRPDLLPIAPLLKRHSSSSNSHQSNLAFPLLPPPPPMPMPILHDDAPPMTAHPLPLPLPLPSFATAAVMPPSQMLPPFTAAAVVPPPQHNPFGQMYGGDGMLGGYYAAVGMYGDAGGGGESTSSYVPAIAPPNFDHHHPYAAFK